MGNQNIDRRSFLKGAAATAATVIGSNLASGTQLAANAAAAQSDNSNAETHGSGRSSEKIIARPGSDFMVDVIKATGIEYIASNPGSSFRSLQESIVNYGDNKKPEFLTCMHEESSVAMAHGYAKAAGKPMGMMAHGTVGLQHAAMAVYNAWCDRVPVVMFAGNFLDADKRRPGVEWYHCVQDPAALLRDFTKWDDQPVSLQHFAESVMRAYKIATTVPMGPVLITADGDLAEEAVHDEKKLRIPKLDPLDPAAGRQRRGCRSSEAAGGGGKSGDPGRPRLAFAGRHEAAGGARRSIERAGGRYRRPHEFSHHPLSLPQRRPSRQLVGQADVALLLEVADPWGQFNTISDPHHEYRRLAKPDVKVIHVFSGRHADEIELPGYAALHAGGSADLRRRPGNLAGIDRGGEECDQH